MSTSSNTVAQPSQGMSGISTFHRPSTAGQKRRYSSYIDQTDVISHHASALISFSCTRDAANTFYKNAITAPSTLALPPGLRTDNNIYLPYPNGEDPEHARKAQETSEFIARATFAYHYFGSNFCDKIEHLDTIHAKKLEKKTPLLPVPRKTRDCKSTKDKAEEIAQRIDAFKPSFDHRKVAPIVTSRKSSASTEAIPSTLPRWFDLTPPVATSSTATSANSSTAPVAPVSAPTFATSQTPTDQTITAIVAPATVDTEEKEPVEATYIVVKVDDESACESNVDDDTAISFVGEPIAQNPIDIVKQDVNNFNDSGICMELPESFDVNYDKSVLEQLPDSVEMDDDEAVAQQSLSSESNEHMSSANDSDDNATADNAVTPDAVDTVATAESTPDDPIDTQEASQSNIVSNIEDTSSTPETVDAVEGFLTYVTQLQFYEGSLGEIRTRLLNIMKQHDDEEPKDDERPTKRVSQWVEKYMENIAKVFLPIEQDLDEDGVFEPGWFDRSSWSNPQDCRNLLLAILLVESMLVWSFEETIHKDDRQIIAPTLARIKNFSPVEDLGLEMYASYDIRNLIMKRDVDIRTAVDSNETRNNLLATSKFNPTDISKLLILAEHARGADTEVMESLRITLRRIRGILLYKGAESKVSLPGWPEVARKIPETLHETSTYELLKDLQLHNFVPDIENRVRLMIQLDGQSPADIEILQCLPLVRKVLKDMTVSEDECRSKLQKFFDVDFPILDRVITPELESQYLEIRQANPETKTPVIETVNKAYDDFFENFDKIRNSNRWRSTLTRSINFGKNHQDGLKKLLSSVEITADPCGDIDLVKEVRDTLQRVWKTLIFDDAECIAGNEGASSPLQLVDLSNYLQELDQRPDVGSSDSFLAQLDSPSHGDVQMTDIPQEDDSEVVFLKIFDETSLKIQTGYNNQGVVIPATYEHVNVDPNKSATGFWNFDERKFLEWIDIHMAYLDGITALVTEIPQGGHNEKSLLRQIYYRNRTLEHIDLTRKRVGVYLKKHQRSTAIDGMLSILEDRQLMMNKVQAHIQRHSYLSKKPCPMVNTQEGCKDRQANVCQYHHDNEGKRCKSDQEGKTCKFNEKNKCYYMHISPEAKLAEQTTRGPSQVMSGNPNRPCPYVNKSGGCAGELNRSCLFFHKNKGKMCKNVTEGKICKFGDTCAYIHQQDQAFGNPHSTGSQSPVAEVLRGPKHYTACSFVNRPSGCTKGDSCSFDHSLQGVPCPDQNCSEKGCKYLHNSTSRTHASLINAADGLGQTQSPAASQQGQPFPTPRTQGSGSQQHINALDGQIKAMKKERIKADHAKAQSQCQTQPQNVPTGPRSMQQQTGSLNWQPHTLLPRQDANPCNAVPPFSQPSAFQGFQNTQPSGGFGSSSDQPTDTGAITRKVFEKGCEDILQIAMSARSSNSNATGHGGFASQNSRGGNQSYQHSYGGNQSYSPGTAVSYQNRGSNQLFGYRSNASQQSRNVNQSSKRPRDNDVDMADDDFRPKRFRG
ncbi:hypothetical protein PTTW11_10274 [Pyrenophora teres f. teres]|uniref:C3H1-type domain-containing protein n=1 Tax=Pyrenophora teres f. teres TaxID=97479 RepID=A0A6S6WJ46_9PLEO|nr:hypothetical protein PTTW11_10274 [Pyrenophora teres f. teres]